MPTVPPGAGFKSSRCEQGLDTVGVVGLEPELAPARFAGGVAHVPGRRIVATGVVAGGLGPLEEAALATNVGLLIRERRR